ncbi:hypothetical protein GCM10018793_41140 [Streptomyces sulfonofaciens]|uniref:Uncharacterized protein n=1 Tax=Streptomyces sulfonofaciens TaxID=68272 RepID=A0A919GCA8_9ACTN|nr:hypothetical protein GCM10018793_41140 [Streptomyces sulfonofaciens]
MRDEGSGRVSTAGRTAARRGHSRPRRATREHPGHKGGDGAKGFGLRECRSRPARLPQPCLREGRYPTARCASGADRISPRR